MWDWGKRGEEHKERESVCVCVSEWVSESVYNMYLYIYEKKRGVIKRITAFFLRMLLK